MEREGPRRGRLRIYVGYAPGVGKTYAMLAEARRRRDRGTDVVIGSVQPHGREPIDVLAGDLEIVPPRMITEGGAASEEMDVDAVIARDPQLAVVDELAHRNLPGSRNANRWRDVEELLAAGIDVTSTVNVHHLESLREVVERITGAAPVDTVPDSLVRTADQLQLVDMTPQALLRRMANGDVFPPERVDAALARLFREDTLARLRELALLWMADRVDEELNAVPTGPQPTDVPRVRERILVGVSGRGGDDVVVRRAARMAARRGGDLLVVHVIPRSGHSTVADLEAVRMLADRVGGRYEEVVGRDIAESLLEVARAEAVTLVVLGTSERSWLAGILRRSVINEVIKRSGTIDVQVISQGSTMPRVMTTPQVSGLSRNRQVIASAAGASVLIVLTAILAVVASQVAPSTVMLLYLTVVVGVAFGGGLRPAVPAAVASVLLINWYFTPPVHTWKIADREDVVALVVFIVVAVSVSVLVDREARHRAEAQHRRAEAEALARLTARVAAEDDPLPGLVEHLRTTFGLGAVSVLRKAEGGWERDGAAGVDPPGDPDDADQTVELGRGSVLALRGDRLPADALQLLSAFAAQLAIAVRGRALAREAGEAAALAEADALRTAILAAVSHDLRTPLASIKASASSLRDEDVAWSPEESAQFLETIEEEADRLTGLVENLLDMSRLRAGALTLVRGVVGFDEVVPRALASLSGGGRGLVVDVPEALPRIAADAGLLERAIANIVANASTWSPLDRPVQIRGSTVGDRVELRVVDQGSGVRPEDRERMFRPFQRLGDRPSGNGVGLGLAVAKGFIDAMDGDLRVEDTPGGGLTMVIGFQAVAP